MAEQSYDLRGSPFFMQFMLMSLPARQRYERLGPVITRARPLNYPQDRSNLDVLRELRAGNHSERPTGVRPRPKTGLTARIRRRRRICGTVE